MGVFGLTQVINKMLNVRLIGGGATEPVTGSNNVLKTFTRAMSGFCISNDSEPGKPGAGDISFYMDGHDTESYTVKPGEVFESRFEPFIQVQIIANNIPYRAFGMVAVGTTITPTAPPPDTTAPYPAANLRTTAKTVNSVTLAWDASSSLDVTSYDVFRGTTIANGVLQATATSNPFTLTNLQPATVYDFFIRAKDSANNRSEASNILNVTTDAPPPDTTPPTVNPSVPRGRPFEQQFTVTLSATDNIAVDGIFYTLDGTTPTNASTRYTAPILINGTADVTLKYIAYDTAGNASNVRTESFTYSQKTGGTGFGAAPTPAGGLWQDMVLTNIPGDTNNSTGWKGSPFFMHQEKRLSHVALTCTIAGNQPWQLWELKTNPNTLTRGDGTTAPAGSTLLFSVLRADGTTANPVDTAGLGDYLIASLQYEITLEANKWYALLLNNDKSGFFHYAATDADRYKNVNGVITTGHAEGIYNDTTLPVVNRVFHTQNQVKPYAYDHQVYLKD